MELLYGNQEFYRNAHSAKSCHFKATADAVRNRILEVAHALYCLTTTYLTRSKIYFSGAAINFALRDKAFVRKCARLKALFLSLHRKISGQLYVE